MLVYRTCEEEEEEEEEVVVVVVVVVVERCLPAESWGVTEWL